MVLSVVAPALKNLKEVADFDLIFQSHPTNCMSFYDNFCQILGFGEGKSPSPICGAAVWFYAENDTKSQKSILPLQEYRALQQPKQGLATIAIFHTGISLTFELKRQPCSTLYTGHTVHLAWHLKGLCMGQLWPGLF